MRIQYILNIIFSCTSISLTIGQKTGLSVSLDKNLQQFKEDSITTFNNDLVKVGFLPSLKTSDAELEIRFYTPVSKVDGYVQVLRLANNGVNATKYIYHNLESLWGNIDAYTEEQKMKARREALLKKDSIIYSPSYTSNEILKILDRLNIFSFTDQSGLLDSLQAKHIKIVDPCEARTDCKPRGLTMVEIKYKNHFKNFYLLMQDYFAVNKEISVFERQHITKMVFDKIFNK